MLVHPLVTAFLSGIAAAAAGTYVTSFGGALGRPHAELAGEIVTYVGALFVIMVNIEANT